MKGFTKASVEALRVIELAALAPSGRLELRISRRLRTPNSYSKMHYRDRHRETKEWQAHLQNALVGSLGIRTAQALLKPESGLPGCTGGCRDRRRVEVTRIVPSKKHLITDDDNLRFSVKPLLDALKRLGLIFDDRRGWIEHPTPTQEISADKTFWTWIALDQVNPA